MISATLLVVCGRLYAVKKGASVRFRTIDLGFNSGRNPLKVKTLPQEPSDAPITARARQKVKDCMRTSTVGLHFFSQKGRGFWRLFIAGIAVIFYTGRR